MPSLRIGSRESPLALVQAKTIMNMLKEAWPDLSLELFTYRTSGDKFLGKKLSEIGGDKGLFVKELEIALQENKIDVAIHSLKDVPGKLPDGLALQSVGMREDPRDAMVSIEYMTFKELPQGATIGTSSLRRLAQLKRLRPDLKFETLRGNLQTRYKKLEGGNYDAIILAAAGLKRMGWSDRIRYCFDPVTEIIPAVGQGILAAEYRSEEQETARILAKLIHPATEATMQAERAVLSTLDVGCNVPLGVYASLNPSQAGHLSMRGILLSPDGRSFLEETITFPWEDAHEKGVSMGLLLLEQGGRELLKLHRE